MRRKVLLGVFLLLLCFCGVGISQEKTIQLGKRCFLYPDTVKYETFDGRKYITYWAGRDYPNLVVLKNKKKADHSLFFIVADREKWQQQVLKAEYYLLSERVFSWSFPFTKFGFSRISPDSNEDVILKAAIEILDTQEGENKK